MFSGVIEIEEMDWKWIKQSHVTNVFNQQALSNLI